MGATHRSESHAVSTCQHLSNPQCSATALAVRQAQYARQWLRALSLAGEQAGQQACRSTYTQSGALAWMLCNRGNTLARTPGACSGVQGALRQHVHVP